MIHNIENRRNITTFVFGTVAGMLMTLSVITFFAVKPRVAALQKAWMHYDVIEDLDIKESTSIAKK